MATTAGDRFVRRHNAARGSTSNTTAADITYDTAELSDGDGYTYNGPDVEVDTAGKYLATFDLGQCDLASTRAVGTLVPRVNGVDQTRFRASHRYLRNSGGTEGASIGMAILDLAATDDVRVRNPGVLTPTDALGNYATRVSYGGGLQLLRLPDGNFTHVERTVDAAECGISNINATRPWIDSSGTWTKITYNSEVADDDSLYPGTGGDVTLAASTKYLIVWGATIYSTDPSRHAYVTAVNIGGTRRQTGSSYQRDTNSQGPPMCGAYLYETGGTTETLFLEATQETEGADAGTPQVSDAYLQVIELPATAEWIHVDNGATDSLTTALAGTATYYDTPLSSTVRADGGSNLSLDAANDAVQNDAGAALAVLAIGWHRWDRDSVASGVRKMPWTRWENGGFAVGYGVAGAYSRGQQSTDDTWQAHYCSTALLDLADGADLKFQVNEPASASNSDMGIYASTSRHFLGVQVLDLSSLASAPSVPEMAASLSASLSSSATALPTSSASASLSASLTSAGSATATREASASLSASLTSAGTASVPSGAVPCVATVMAIESVDGFLNGGVTSASFTPPANSRLFAMFATWNNNNTIVGTPSVSGGSLTWTKNDDFDIGAGGDNDANYIFRHWLFEAPVGGSPSSMTVTMDGYGVTCDSAYGYVIVAVEGAVSEFVQTAIVDPADNSGGTGASSQTADLDFVRPPASGNLQLYAAFGDTDDTTSTFNLPTGWTEVDSDGTAGRVPVVLYESYTNTSAGTHSATITSSGTYHAGGFGIEFAPADKPAIASHSSADVTAGSTLTLDKPPGTVEGDLLIGIFGSDIDPGSWQVTSGTTWTTRFNADGEGRLNALTIISHIAGGSEPSTYTFESAGSNDEHSGMLLRITGHGDEGASEWLDSITTAIGNNDDATPAARSITPTADNCLVLSIIWATGYASVTPLDAPAGLNGPFIVHEPADPTRPLIQVAHELQTTAAASPSADWWVGNTASAGVDSEVIALAITPSAAGSATAEYVGEGAVAPTSGASVAVNYPSTSDGEYVLLFAGNANSGLDIPGLTGSFTQLATDTGGDGSAFATIDGGDRRATVWGLEADGTETGSETLSQSTTSGDSLIGQQSNYSKAGGTWSVEAVAGDDSTDGTALSVTFPTIGIEPGDLLVVHAALNSDTPTPSGEAISATGITFGAITNRESSGTAAGVDTRLEHWTVPVTAGSGTVAVTFSATYSAAISGALTLVRLRAGTAAAAELSASLSASLDSASTAVATQAIAASLSADLTSAAAATANRITSASLSAALTSDATAAKSSVMAASLSGSLTSSGAATGIATMAATLSAGLTSSATALGTRSTSASLSAALVSSGAITTSATMSAALSASLTSAATATATNALESSLSADLTSAATALASRSMAADLSASLTSSGSASSESGMTASLSAGLTSTATATATRSLAASLSASATSTGTAQATRVAASSLSAALASTATATGSQLLSGSLSAALTSSGAVAATATLAASLSAALGSDGTATATRALVADLSANLNSAGTASGGSGMSASLSASLDSSGTAVATRSLAASLSAALDSTGTATATRLMSASLTAELESSGVATIPAATPELVASLSAALTSTATAVGTATASASLSAALSGAGAATGVHTLAGGLSASLTSAGAATGTTLAATQLTGDLASDGAATATRLIAAALSGALATDATATVIAAGTVKTSALSAEVMLASSVASVALASLAHELCLGTVVVRVRPAADSIEADAGSVATVQ